MNTKVNILGVEYEIFIVPEDCTWIDMKHVDGRCSFYDKKICICDLTSKKSYNSKTDISGKALDQFYRETARHEIINAFLYESGLSSSSMVYEGAWAKCEEMIDYFAIQGPKLLQAWKDADVL